MDLIKSGLGFTQTMKNMGRFREIVSVLARNGLDEFIIKTGLQAKLPNFVLPKSRLDKALAEYDEDSWAQTFGYRLRCSFEELGPGFVKLGQLISTREDIFPPSFIQEMKKLQDQVKGITFEEARGVLESSLEDKIENLFTDFQEKPIGTASIGVVFKAKLKTGEDVVVKVRRPNILKTIKRDVALLTNIISQIERVSTEVRHLGLSKIVRDFGVTLETELDYRMEARYCERFKANMDAKDTDGVFHIPTIYKDYCSDEVLVMELLDGIPFSDSKRINEVKEVVHEQLEKGIRLFVHSILADGFFHADLHGGNFFLLEGNKIGIIDYGLMGVLGSKSRDNLIAILYALTNHNYENLVYEFLDVAEYDVIPDVDGLIRDIRESLSPFVGLTVQEVNATAMLRSMMGTLARHEIFLPRDWFLVFRAMMTLDGVGRSLEMDFDIFGIVAHDIKDIIKNSFSKEQLTEEAMWMGRDMVSAMRGVPRHLRWFLKESAKRNYALEIHQHGYEKQFQGLNRSVKFLGMSIFSGLLAFCGVFSLQGQQVQTWGDIPSLSWVFWALSSFSFGWGYVKARKKRSA